MLKADFNESRLDDLYAYRLLIAEAVYHSERLLKDLLFKDKLTVDDPSVKELSKILERERKNLDFTDREIRKLRRKIKASRSFKRSVHAAGT